MRRLGRQTAIVEHRGVRRLPSSYGQIARAADWFAAELIRRTIEPGDRVVLWGENSAAWVACFFGCVLRGVLVVPLDAGGAVSFAERIVRETAPRLIVGDVLLLRSLVPPTEPAQTVSLQTEPARMTLAALDAPMRSSSIVVPAWPAPGLGPDTPLQILFTSGTTGEPKGIVHTHGNLLASLAPIEREIVKYRRYERFVHPLHILHTLPLSHVFGQFMGLWVAPVLGAVVHYESRLEAARLLRILRQERISVLAAVPRVLSLLRAGLLADYPSLAAGIENAEGVPIGKRWWRFRRIHARLGYGFWAIVCGGATLPEALERFWTTLGVALIQGYGMTETSALVTLNHPFKPARGTLGAPLPGRELRISDDGELLVRGPMVATTTWQNGRLQPGPAAENQGWLATGDLTRRDERGKLHYMGRTGQRLVTSAGLNVYLEDVEAAIAEQPGIDAAVVVPIEGIHGPEPGAVVRAAALPIAARAIESANARLAPYQRVACWWLWPELDLPRTATGKVRRGVVEAWVAARLQPAAKDASAPPASSPTLQSTVRLLEDPLPRLLATATGSAVPSAGVTDERTLESLGVDSLARVQLQAALELATGRPIEDGSLAAARTLGDLRRLAGLGGLRWNDAMEAQPATVATLHPAESETGALPSHVAVHQPLHPGSAASGGPDEQAPIPAEPPPAGSGSKARFLYLRWPWAAPFRWLRVLFLETCVRPLVWLLAAPRVECSAGVHEAVLTGEPLLIVANHVSTYDAPLLLYALPPRLRRRVAIAAAGEMLEAWRQGANLFGPVIFWLLTILFNVFPLPQIQNFRRAFLHAGEALDRGYSVLVFPEGARSHGGPIQPFRGGIGLLAQQAGVLVLPVALEQRRSRKTLRPFHTTIRISQPLAIHAGEEAHAITLRLQGVVTKLLARSDEPASN